MSPLELRRYTSLPAALRILQTQAITLLPPDTWEDLNDRRLIEAYRKANNFTTVLALCFAEAPETYHHWKIYAGGSNGVCLVFDKAALGRALAVGGVRHASVRYYTVDELEQSDPRLCDLPFAKRNAYRDESEYRVLYIADEPLRCKDVPIPVAAINRAIINPWLPEALAAAVKTAIRSIPQFDSLEVVQSRVTDGPAWRLLADRYA